MERRERAMESMGITNSLKSPVDDFPLEQQDMLHRIVKDDMDYIGKKFTKAHLFSGQTILITGGGGFIGYYLVLSLLNMQKKGAEVKQINILDRFPRGVPQWLQDLEAEGWPVKAIQFDVTQDSFTPFTQDADYIFHLASIASPTYYRKYPLDTLEANVFGLKRLLDSCLPFSPKGILFFSSSEVYGNPNAEFIPTPETYNGNVATVGPRACYDESKRFGETLCSLYHSENKLPIRIVRPFNNFGPGLDLNDRRIASDFTKAIKEQSDINVLSDGTPTRTYCYIADAIIGYLLVLTHHRFDIFNIGSDADEINVTDLAHLFAECALQLTGNKPEITYSNSPDPHYLTDNPERRCPNIDKARKELDFNPEISLEEGIRRYLVSCGVGL
ncbi:NAD-dependent epimerase/dehydratase family protein [Paenibacillus sp. RU5M]|uniref:NAD-dependent epimerase/dehydratase family protein n=2 Tax=Paenibacillus TaxID=44249 RepID=UPI001C547F48|nr:NAD-dependent epimerase/dehydratase family protein [Paenibacillus sp. RU5M]